MSRIIVITALAAALALAAARSGGAASGLCVGGPHCYATIQAALDAANDGDAIRVAPGTYAGGIVITKSVALVGGGAQSTTISGGGPVVTIGSRTSTPSVALTGLTITDGVATSDPQAPKCGPDVPRCGPGYTDATALGGGIEAFPGTTVVIRSSAVTGNRAEPTISVASVKAKCPGGVACPASFGAAAGIDNWGTMMLESTTVGDNHAAGVQSNGGGIVAEADSSLTLVNSRVVGNSAAAVSPYGRFVSGGGIYVAGGAVFAVANSAIDRNSAMLANSIPHPYPIQGGTDAANAFGGGVLLADGSSASIRNSTLDGNAVEVDSAVGEPFGADAALCACGDVTLTVENTEIAGNTLDVNTSSSADVGPSGGIFEADGTTTIRNTRITGNSIDVTTATGDAAATGTIVFLWFGGPTPTVDGGSVSDNTVTATAPGGVATIQGVGITNNGPLLLANAQVDRNRGTATGASGFARGGGIWNGQLFAGADSPLTLSNTRVADNALIATGGVTAAGGGVYSDGFPVTLDHSTIVKNTPDDCVGCRTEVER